MKKVLIIIILMVVYSLYIENVNGQEILEEKIYCNATLDDDFAEDRVLIILTKDASQNNKIYSIYDFPNIGCINVENITYFRENQAN